MAMEFERLPTFAGGLEFTHIPDHVQDDLDTLQRECAIYADHWIEEVGDFRHVRIDFTQQERVEFFRRSWAYELFLRADMPEWAIDTPGIDTDIALEADSYSMHLRDGTVVPPPYHCFAAFLGEHLEALVCFNTDRQTVIERLVVLELDGREKKLLEIRRAIESLTPTIRKFNNREKGLNPWPITCEDDVRDLLYAMLRAFVYDIRPEEPTPSKAGTFKFADLCSNSVELMIELKWIDKKGDWKKKVDDICVDTLTYITHPACNSLFFVLVDNIKDIPDPRQLEAEMSGLQVIDGRSVDVQVIVCEP